MEQRLGPNQKRDNPGIYKSNRGSPNEGVLVIIEDYDPLNHRVKVKRLSDGKPLEGVRSINQNVEQVKSYEFEDKKVLKADDDPKGPITETTRAFARISGSNNSGFFSYKEGSNFIKGPVSFISTPNQVRIGALTTLNPLIIAGFPSTIVTPLPTCVWSFPSASAIKPLMKSVLIASTLLAAAGSG